VLKFVNLVVLSVLLTFSASAQTTAQVTEKSADVVFTAPDGTEGVVGVEWHSQFCDVTCTGLSYSFCINETPGCLEGFGEIPDGTLKGTVNDNYLLPNVLSIDFNAVTTDHGTSTAFFFNYYCYSFDEYGNCTNEVVAPGGLINMAFIKTPVAALISTDAEKTIGNGTIQTSTSIYGQFSNQGEGTVMDQLVIPSSNVQGCEFGVCGSMQFMKQINSTKPSQAAAKSASKMLESKMLESLPEKARARLRVLEKRRQQSRTDAVDGVRLTPR
jgi:hypothetical protein